jgi:hypothetical protein
MTQHLLEGFPCDTLTTIVSDHNTTLKGTLMKMLQIVCGKRFEDEIVALFKELEIKGYTVISGVGGSGATGTVPASNSITGHGTNTLFMVALGYEAAFLPKIVAALKELRAKHIQGHDDREIPLKVFLQPCEIII